MKLFTLMLPPFWSLCLTLLLLTSINSLLFDQRTHASASGNETDHFTLLKFKESISNDPRGILDSWNSSIHFCMWHGITCSPMQQRVTQMNLGGYHLYGVISPLVGNLSFLEYLDLRNNSFYGKIPPQLGRLVQLQQLYLNNNSLVGEIPANLTSCFNLIGLHLSGNNLTGKIPNDIGSLRKLQQIFISSSNLTGQVPPSIGNLSSLTDLNVGSNSLEGNIPQEMCRLKNLKTIAVGINNLSGNLPSCLYNMSSLTLISVDMNRINGSLSPTMFHTLPNLQTLFIGGNQMSGPIPTSITNATTLQAFDITRNHFVGQVPSLGKLKDLQLLGLAQNNLGGNSTKDLDFLKSLTNCSKLYVIDISTNNFGGYLPDSLGNMSSQFNYLYAGDNYISGKFPVTLGNLINLILLTMENNRLEGTIPATFGNFQKIQVLELIGNKLSGKVPAFIGNFSQLFHLGLGHNMFEGNIPPSIGNCQKLQYLDLSQNNLRGTIPSEVFSLSSLTNLLDLSQNSLSGSIPEEVGMVNNINTLNFSENHLSGEIPETFGECLSMEYLYLQGNSFDGIIPTSLASLKGLQRLDLSRNNLSGSIPKSLQNISVLEYLNVSFNMLDGEVPTEGVFQNASEFAVNGNNKLCGGISKLHLPPCPVNDKKPTKHHSFRVIAVIVSVVGFLFLLSFILTIYWMKKRNKKAPSDFPTIDHLAKISYRSLHLGTDGFSTRNLIGSGGFGSVYKGTFGSEDRIVAIKVLNLHKKGAYKSFIVECNALKNIRHRNLVKILTCCSSTDYEGQEFKALVFEYMKNGNLEQWLHPRTGNAEKAKILYLFQRINIIIDVASALHYLHHECEPPIVHCDLKPSNVLLDDNLVAHVSDFGLARLLSTNIGSSKQTSTIGIKGTIGYAPPEYGFGSEMSTQGDVYSFGILMLEMLTGRSPTDETFKDGQNLHNFVEVAFPDNLLQILDPSLVPLETEDATEEDVEKCLVSLFQIGLACSMESPKNRMSMMNAIRQLNIIRKAFHTEEQYRGVESCEEFKMKSVVNSSVERDEKGDKSMAEMDTRNKSEHFSTTDSEEEIITIE
ncbi:probable LRR receptor-like serine/threonine-protein kinase At3g47570 [Abrus precatorius]|uniref:non-specific serine/threonine protein kinase n=1 Tax=Abrus precatorius TaxID=3816 RepID=A0A8B8M1V7_ABRPR|nr:probable LRR receptor-like serine/threonine-protein kinase At3g47570 [Abrus precatorius]